MSKQFVKEYHWNILKIFVKSLTDISKIPEIILYPKYIIEIPLKFQLYNWQILVKYQKNIKKILKNLMKKFDKH